MTTTSQTAILTIALAILPLAATSADLAGTVFRDKNRNGLRDPGEEGVAAMLEVFGTKDAGGVIDANLGVASDGSLVVGPSEIENGCYLLRLTPPAGFRLALPRADCPGQGLAHPVGTRRYGSPRGLIDRLRGGSLRYFALGDSIAEPVSGCAIFPRDATDYVKWLGQRLGCVGTGVVRENEAIGGMLTPDLLQPAGTCGPPNLPVPGDPGDRCDNIFDTIARGAELIAISIGGNDWRDAEPADQTEPFDPAEVQASVNLLLSARANLQEILSTLASELPTADVIVNSVYDPSAPTCASTDFHNLWIPIWDQMLREVTWGQGERFGVAEVYPEYAHQDVNGGNCCGRRDAICLPGVDGIHPNVDGAEMHLEKVWDAVGGVSLGPKDGIAATSNPNVDFPVVELVATRFPSAFDDRTTGVTTPDAVFARDDAGATVPAGVGEFVVHGFDASPADIVPTHVVVAVRYRTVGTAGGGDPRDGHWLEASVDGNFQAPQFTVTGWNTMTPIVGAGPTAPAPNALPDVPQWREVRAFVSRQLSDDGRATGVYDFRAPDWADVATLAVRLRRDVRGGVDPVAIEWDAAWIEVYGYRSSGLTVYRSSTAQNLLTSPFTTVTGAPFDDVAAPVPVLFYAVSDGAGFPARIDLIRQGAGVRIGW